MMRFIKTGLISIGSFGLGAIFQYNYNKYKKHLRELIPKEVKTPKNTQVAIQDNVLDVKPKKIMDPTLFKAINTFGYPSYDSVFIYQNFIISFNCQHRIANWVLEYLSPEEAKTKTFQRKSDWNFLTDGKIHKYFRVMSLDYKDSGYDRGHMAAAGNYKFNEKYMKNTFIYSNLAPQVGEGFNRGKWKELEHYARYKAISSDGLWICTGPLFLSQYDSHQKKYYVKYEVIGLNQIAVPTHFFKVITYKQKNKFFMEAFIMPNMVIDDKVPIESFRVDPEIIERAAGLLFFRKLSRNNVNIIF